MVCYTQNRSFSIFFFLFFSFALLSCAIRFSVRRCVVVAAAAGAAAAVVVCFYFLCFVRCGVCISFRCFRKRSYILELDSNSPRLDSPQFDSDVCTYEWLICMAMCMHRLSRIYNKLRIHFELLLNSGSESGSGLASDLRFYLSRARFFSL